MYVALKLIYQSLDNKFKSFKGVPKRSLVRIPPDAGILDSIVDFILTIFFEFGIKSYRYCDIFSVMENLVQKLSPWFMDDPKGIAKGC